jgi:hypothetical protein
VLRQVSNCHIYRISRFRAKHHELRLVGRQNDRYDGNTHLIGVLFNRPLKVKCQHTQRVCRCGMHLCCPPPFPHIHVMIHLCCVIQVCIMTIRLENKIRQKIWISPQRLNTIYNIMSIEIKRFAPNHNFMAFERGSFWKLMVDNLVQLITILVG